jgi:hypothetical protein
MIRVGSLHDQFGAGHLGNRPEQLVADACKAAGIVGKSGHGVRKAAATEAADNEATHAQLNSIFGWKGDKMASLYTESADRKRLVAGAIAKLSRASQILKIGNHELELAVDRNASGVQLVEPFVERPRATASYPPSTEPTSYRWIFWVVGAMVVFYLMSHH